MDKQWTTMRRNNFTHLLCSDDLISKKLSAWLLMLVSSVSVHIVYLRQLLPVRAASTDIECIWPNQQTLEAITQCHYTGSLRLRRHSLIRGNCTQRDACNLWTEPSTRRISLDKWVRWRENENTLISEAQRRPGTPHATDSHVNTQLASVFTWNNSCIRCTQCVCRRHWGRCCCCCSCVARRDSLTNDVRCNAALYGALCDFRTRRPLQCSWCVRCAAFMY